MAHLTGANLETLLLENLQANVTTDPPISTVASAGSVASAQTYVHLNDAYGQIFELWGGTITKATSATLWTPDVTADTTGVLAGDLQTIAEIRQVWSTTTSGSTGGGSGDVLLDMVDYAEILFLRANASRFPYAEPVCCSVHQKATTTVADINKWQLDVYPGVSGRYFPAWYIPQFTPMTAATDVPDVSDLAQRDIAHLAAYNVCDLIGRPEFKQTIQLKLTEKTRLWLKRRESAKVDARQDK